MQTFAVLALLSAVFAATAFAAPAHLEDEVNALLAETQDTDQQLASIEQETFKQLVRFFYNQTLAYLKEKLRDPASSQEAGEDELDFDRDSLTEKEMAEIEQSTLRSLLGSVLDSANRYAQQRLANGRGRSRNPQLRDFLGNVLNGANNYAQNKLQPSAQGLLSLDPSKPSNLDNVVIPPDDLEASLPYRDSPSEKEMAEIEQSTLRELFGSVLDSTNRYAQQRLANGRGRSRNPQLRDFLGNVLNGVNNYAQNKLQPTELEMAVIEQSTFRDLLGSVLDSTNRYAQQRLANGRGRSRNPQLRDFLGSVLNGANNYAQNKLRPTELEMAEIEQSTFRELLSTLLNSTTNYAQGKLSRGGRGSRDGTGFRNFLSRLLNGASNYAQRRLQPSAQGLTTTDRSGLYRFAPLEGKKAEIESLDFQDIEPYLDDSLGSSLRLPESGTDTDDIVKAMTEDEATQQALSAVIVPLLTSAASSLIGRFLSSSSSSGTSTSPPSSPTYWAPSDNRVWG